MGMALLYRTAAETKWVCYINSVCRAGPGMDVVSAAQVLTSVCSDLHLFPTTLPTTAHSFIQQTFWGLIPASPVLGAVGNRQKSIMGLASAPPLSPSGAQP